MKQIIQINRLPYILQINNFMWRGGTTYNGCNKKRMYFLFCNE